MDKWRGIVNKRKALCLSVLLIWSGYALAELDVSETAKTLTQYMYMQNLDKPKEERIKALDVIKEQIAAELKLNSNDPVMWWLNGLADLSYVYAWNLSWKDDPKNIDIIQDQKMVAVEKFRKALELDTLDNPKLTLEMLYSLKNFGSSDVHVEAASRILETDENIDSKKEMEIRGGMATHFIRLGKYDEAINILEEWAKKYPDKTRNVSGYINHAQQMIEEAKQKQQAEDKPTEKAMPPVEEPKQPNPVTQQPVAKPKSANETPDPHVSDEAQYKQWVLILALIAIGLAAIAYIIRRPRK